jgi:hypothetical protein
LLCPRSQAKRADKVVFFFFDGRKMNKKNERKKTDLGAPAAGAAPSHFFLVRIYLDIHSLFFPPSIVLLFFFSFYLNSLSFWNEIMLPL